MDNRKFSGIFIPRTSFYIWTIILLVGIIVFLDWRMAIPGIMLMLLIIYHNFRSNLKRQKEITKYIENLTFNIDTASKDTILNFPMPLVVTEIDGAIIWYNSLFRKMFEGEVILEKNINSIIKDIRPDELVKSASGISSQVTIKDTHYLVLGNFVKTESKSGAESYIMLLYFIDITEMVNLKKKYNDEKSCVGIIVIDNYDELMQSVEDATRAQLLAEIDRKIMSWMEFTGGVIKKFERDKYLFIFEQMYLKEFEDKKFDILDSIKEINVGNRIPVTLSVGIGINAETLIEKFQYASTSIDIALGRGGDQAVIKNSDTFSFYGGRTRELEKRTRVKARVIAYALRELIDQSPAVIIMGHENADIDSLGAALGLYRIAKNRGKDTYIVLTSVNTTIEGLLAKIQRNGEYSGVFIGRSEAFDRISRKTLLIIVDTHRSSYTEIPELLAYTDQIVVIDHHRKGTDFIQNAVLTYQETYASSTCELVTEILQYVDEKLRLKPLEAEALYAGIVIDTKNFAFKTGVRTFEAASFLKRQGVDTLVVKQLFQNDLSTYSSISDVVKEAEIVNGNIALSSCPLNTKNAQFIAAKAADELLNLSGIAAAFVFCYVNNEVFISGRSLGDINVQVILEKLGGGGHMTVAGAQLQEISLEDAKEKLKCAIMEYINESGKEQ